MSELMVLNAGHIKQHNFMLITGLVRLIWLGECDPSASYFWWSPHISVCNLQPKHSSNVKKQVHCVEVLQENKVCKSENKCPVVLYCYYSLMCLSITRVKFDTAVDCVFFCLVAPSCPLKSKSRERTHCSTMFNMCFNVFSVRPQPGAILWEGNLWKFDACWLILILYTFHESHDLHL